MEKRAIFGGSFDPIHNGHLALSIAMLEAFELDTVLFSPAAHSPFKKGHHVSVTDRLEMVELAIEPIKAFQLHTWEAKRKEVSYTIDLVEHLIEMGEGASYLILSKELVLSFHKWHRFEELLELVTPLIALPAGQEVPLLPELAKYQEKFLFTQMEMMPISSTLVRGRLAAKLPCDHLVPRKVLDYIYKKRLY